MKRKELIETLDEISDDLLEKCADMNKVDRDKVIESIHKITHLSGYIQGERLGKQHYLYWTAVFVLAGIVAALGFIL